MTQRKHVAEELVQAQAIADRIKAKVDAALAPIAREMRLMDWPAEYRRIVWEVVAREALTRSAMAE